MIIDPIPRVCPVHTAMRWGSAHLPAWLATGEPCTCLVIQVDPYVPEPPREPDMAKPGKPKPYWVKFNKPRWGRQ